MRHPVSARSACIAGLIIAAPPIALACATYNAAQVSQAIQNSPYASDALKSSSCTWGGASQAEVGGKHL